MSLTRWSEIFTSTNRVLDCYVETTEAIKVVEMQDDKIAAGKALKRLNDIQNPSNLMALCILNFITEKIQPFVLQERGINHSEGILKMRTLKKILEKSKYDFPDVLKKYNEIATRMDLSLPNNRQYIARGLTPEQIWRDDVFKPSLESLAKSLETM